MDQYGMTKTKGYIADTQRNYQGNYYYIFPEISASGDLGDGLENNMVLLVNSAGFTVKEDLGDTLTVDEVMTTSPDGTRLRRMNRLRANTRLPQWPKRERQS